uniref:Uncharacterized protein n=1 Tax=Eubacterium cellulosolvens (strain ATCC 43171 / JCM 9499 / 6) TaxID=633697 RepID=I5AXM9_EUBC6
MEEKRMEERKKLTLSVPIDVWEFLNDPSVCSQRGKGDYLAELVRKEIKRRKRRLEKAYRKEQRDEAEWKWDRVPMRMSKIFK